MDFKNQLIELLAQHGITAILEVPPDPKLGDFALPCFQFAKEQKKAPAAIAQELASKMHAEFLEAVMATGPYVNFFIKPSARAKAVLGAIEQGRFWQYGGSKRVLIEYPSPNTNKPLHLGHVRNMVIGSTVVKILRRDGNIVIPVNLNNDRGVHICKSMLAYQRWGNNAQPDKKTDHYVGDYYVLFAKKAQEDPKLEEEAQTMLKAWEDGDPGVRKLWELMRKWALDGFHETYKDYGVTFEKEYFESDIYQDGKQVIMDNLDKFIKDETGAIIAPLADQGLPDKILLRKDGTALYITQDLALTTRKMEEFSPDLQIWVIANEQKLQMQQLFAILEHIGIPKETFFHFSYGMVYLPEGKMKSREGTVIDADDLLAELQSMAQEEIKKRHEDWDEVRIKETARIVALAAIRFFMLKYDPLSDFTFDPKSSLSFEGDTGPYLQYTHARICSILAKAEFPKAADISLLTAPEEQDLLRQLALLPAMFRRAAQEYKLHSLALQLLEVGRSFNSFYHACPVLTAPDDVRAARLYLIEATRRILDEGLELLGITAPREM
jgi:arginyl-tRNA synthetase